MSMTKDTTAMLDINESWCRIIGYLQNLAVRVRLTMQYT